MFSFPVAPLICTVRSLIVPRVPRFTVDPEATFTTRVSTAPPTTPLMVKVWPVSWAPEKVPVSPLPIVTAEMLLKVTPVMSMEAVSDTVLVPVPPSTASPALTSLVAV